MRMERMEAVQKIRSVLNRNDLETAARLKRDTERYRKGFASLHITRNGKEIESAEVEYTLRRHEFVFGCNAFMFGEFPEESQNAMYAERFRELFNLAVFPFYWNANEPEDGKTRYGKESPKIYRRPPPDLILEYCDTYGLYKKAHCIAYPGFDPSWVPRSPEAYLNRLEHRFRELGERYGGRIDIWDIVNEIYSGHATASPGYCRPGAFVERTLELGKKYLPSGAIKVVNEATNVGWRQNSLEYTLYPMFLDNLRRKGFHFDWAGIQHHLFKPDVREFVYENYLRRIDPVHILHYLDGFLEYRLPVHVSEITIPGAEICGGEELQAQIAESLYRCWFSHPMMRGIIWWNLVDHTAAFAPIGDPGGENITKAGMLNFDFSPKLIFTTLKKLIREEWTTHDVLSYRATHSFGQMVTENQIHGFYGDYDLTIRTDDGEWTKSIRLSSNCNASIQVELEKI